MSTFNPQSLSSIQALLANTEIELIEALLSFIYTKQYKNIPTIRTFDLKGNLIPLYKCYGEETPYNKGIEIFEEGKLYLPYKSLPNVNNIVPTKVILTGDVVKVMGYYCTKNFLLVHDSVSDTSLDEFHEEYTYYAHNGYDELEPNELTSDIVGANYYMQPIAIELLFAPLNSDEMYGETFEVKSKYVRIYQLCKQYYHLQNTIDEYTQEDYLLTRIEPLSEYFLPVEVETAVKQRTFNQEA